MGIKKYNEADRAMCQEVLYQGHKVKGSIAFQLLQHTRRKLQPEAFLRACCRIIFAKVRKASFTDSESGNISATSGESTTIFVHVA